jgi:hypothetical protein
MPARLSPRMWVSVPMTMNSAVSSCSRSSQLTGSTMAEQVRLQPIGDRLCTLQMLPYIGSYATAGRVTNASLYLVPTSRMPRPDNTVEGHTAALPELQAPREHAKESSGATGSFRGLMTGLNLKDVGSCSTRRERRGRGRFSWMSDAEHHLRVPGPIHQTLQPTAESGQIHRLAKWATGQA